MSVQKKAIERCVEILATLGAQYRVEHDEWTWDSKDNGSAGVQSKGGGGPRDFKQTGYLTTIKGMKAGEVLVFKQDFHPYLADKAAFMSFAASARAVARHAFGAENIISEVRSKHSTVRSVTILRVA